MASHFRVAMSSFVSTSCNGPRRRNPVKVCPSQAVHGRTFDSRVVGQSVRMQFLLQQRSLWNTEQCDFESTWFGTGGWRRCCSLH